MRLMVFGRAIKGAYCLLWSDSHEKCDERPFWLNSGEKVSSVYSPISVKLLSWLSNITSCYHCHALASLPPFAHRVFRLNVQLARMALSAVTNKVVAKMS